MMLNFQHGHIHYTGLCIPNCRAKWTVPAGFQVIDLNCLIHALILFTAAKSLQSCPTLRDPIDGSPPGSHLPGILQGRTLEWVAISFSNACKWKVKVKSLSRVWLFTTPWTAAHQAPPSLGFSRQEYWSRVPSPSLNFVYRKILTWILYFFPYTT